MSRIEGPPPSDEQIPLETFRPRGQLGKREVKTLTEKSEYTDFVPKRTFLPSERTLEFEASLAWNAGVGYFIWLIASKFLPFLEPPPLYNVQAEGKLKSLQGKSSTDPEVTELLNKIFPDTHLLKQAWLNLQNKPQEFNRFLAHIEELYNLTNNLNLKDTPFVDKKKNQVAQELRNLGTDVAARIIGTDLKKWNERVLPERGDKPLDTFRLYADLEKEIGRVDGIETTNSQFKEEAKQFCIKQLKNFQNHLQQVFTKSIANLNAEITSSANNELRNIFQQIGLQPKETFGENYRILQSYDFHFYLALKSQNAEKNQNLITQRDQLTESVKNAFDKNIKKIVQYSLLEKSFKEFAQQTSTQEPSAFIKEYYTNHKDAFTQDMHHTLTSLFGFVPDNFGTTLDSIVQKYFDEIKYR